MSDTVPPIEDAAPAPQALHAAPIRTSANSDLNHSETIQNDCRPPQTQYHFVPHLSEVMPRNIAPMFKASAPNILTNLRTTTSSRSQLQPVSATTLRMPAHLSSIDPNELKLQPVRGEVFINTAGLSSIPQNAIRKKPSLLNSALNLPGHSSAYPRQSQIAATKGGFQHGKDKSMDFRDGRADVASSLSGMRDSSSFDTSIQTHLLNLRQPVRGRDMVALNNISARNFAEAGAPTPGCQTSEHATEVPSITEVLQRYSTLSPSLQRALVREFLFQIDRYCHALVFQNALTSPNQASGEVQDLLHREAESGGLEYLQARPQAQSSALPKSQTRQGFQGRRLAQIQATSNRSPLSSFAHARVQVQVGAHGAEYFLPQDPNTPSPSLRPVTPSPTSTVPAAGPPPMGLVLSQPSTPSASAPGSRRNRRNMRRTATPKAPSKHCHICCRRPSLNSPHIACGNLAAGTCRKTICEKCFASTNWNGKVDAASAKFLGRTWKCTHCEGVCPSRAQCFIYGRSSERRRKRRQAELEAAFRFENEQGALAQANAQSAMAQIGNALATDAQAGNAQDAYSQVENAQTSNAVAGNVQASNAQDTHKQDAHEQASVGNVQVAEAQAANAQASNVKGTTAQTANVQPGDHINVMTTPSGTPSSTHDSGGGSSRALRPSRSYTLPLSAGGTIAQDASVQARMSGFVSPPLSAAGSITNTSPQQCSEPPSKRTKTSGDAMSTAQQLMDDKGMTTPVTPQTFAGKELKMGTEGDGARDLSNAERRVVFSPPRSFRGGGEWTTEDFVQQILGGEVGSRDAIETHVSEEDQVGATPQHHHDVLFGPSWDTHQA